jgi:hypothetical protein
MHKHLSADQQKAFQVLSDEIRAALETLSPIDTEDKFHQAQTLMLACAHGATVEVALAIGFEAIRLLQLRVTAALELASLRRHGEA